MAVSGSGGRRGRSVAEQVADGSIQAGPEPGAAAGSTPAGKVKQPAGSQVYVVQRLVRRGGVGENSEYIVEWRDVATVTVPARSKRKTVIAAAREEVEFELPATLRILDVDAAREIPVGLKPRDPELVIG